MVEETINVYITVDNDNYVTGWSTSKNPLDDTEITVATTYDDILFKIDVFTAVKLVEDTLVFDEVKYLNLKKASTLDRLAYECHLDILKGFNYEGIFYSYSEKMQTTYQNVANKFTLLNVDSPVVISGVDATGATVTTSFDKAGFLTFFSYALLMADYKEHLLTARYAPLVSRATSIEELANITYSSEETEEHPFPEKPIIDTNNDGAISQEEFDALAQENKELKQKVELNELALMDAISMLSSMITG